MSIYDVDGQVKTVVYDADGSAISPIYDIDGNQIGGASLVVMSYNVQWFTGLNSNESMQQGIIDDYAADVIGFQEFNQSTAVPSIAETLLSDYEDIDVGTYGNRNAIASKYALSDFATIPHTTQTMDGQSYSTANITVDGKDILVVVSHLTTSDYETAKVEQAHEIYEAVQNVERFIILGDFNTVCKSVNDTEYTTIMKQFIDAGYHSANCSEQHGFLNTWTNGHTASGTWYPCDQIITSGNIIITNVVVDESKIAVAEQTGQSIDHLPIIAYLSI